MIIDNINNFDQYNTLNNMADSNIRMDDITNINGFGINEFESGLENLSRGDNSEIIKQIVTINENIGETVKNAISVSGLELTEKLNSIFHIDISAFF